MTEVKLMRYTKDNGESSERQVILVSRPRKNYLMYDVSNLSEEALETFLEILSKSKEYQENCIADFELLTGVEQRKLWRSFKPEGVEWITENETEI